ncbi:MAG: PfaB family protein [Desulfobacterales bacterium]
MTNRIAIVGIEAAFGSADRLDRFEQKIYDGVFPENRELYQNDIERWPDDVQETLKRVIGGALKDTNAGSAPKKPDEAFLIVAAEAEFCTKENGLKAFAVEDRLLPALKIAKGLLEEQKADSVAVAAMGRAGAGAVVLKRYDRAVQDQDRIYAVIDSMGFDPFIEPSDVSEISYMEICGQNLKDLFRGAESTVTGIFEKEKKLLSCALGSTEHISDNSALSTHNAGLMAGIIKTALCLYHRYIPAFPLWTTPQDLEKWERSPFYVPTGSRPWFKDGKFSKRKAAVLFKKETESGHLILSEGGSMPPVVGTYISNAKPFCLPVAGDSQKDLTDRLRALGGLLKAEYDLQGFCRKRYYEFSKRENAPYALMLVGGTTDELAQEAAFISKTIPGAFGKKAEIRTPRGSYFSANPLGKKGKVVFVYPGVGSAYVGLGQNLFHMFPGVYDQIGKLVADVGRVLKAKELYPKTCSVYSDDQLKALERVLRKDIMAVSECGMAFSVIYTMIMAGYFKLIPDMAMGYSMGEASMMVSLMVWQNPGRLSNKLRENNAFKNGLHGELTAVRKSWGIASSPRGEREKIWESFTLFADRKTVQAEVDRTDRVYLTLINTESEVVIAGDPEACVQIAEKIGCTYFPLRLDLAIHSEPAHLEYDNLVDLYTLPVDKNNPIKFYSSSCYMPVPLRSKAVAHSTAKAFCNPVDFPKLVNKTWEDGARIYIETGSRQTCSLWISEILKEKESVAVPMNIKGAGDQPALTRALAQLVGHRVKVDLACLF